MSLDRFSVSHWKEKPFVSKYDPSDYVPQEARLRACDVCDEGHAGIFEAPEKCRIVWCRYCDESVKISFRLTEEDVNYV